jgi:hypothetical protein
MRLHLPPDNSHEPEHPVVAWAGLVAIVLAVLLIVWARLAVRGAEESEPVMESGATAAQFDSAAKNPAGENGGRKS